MNEWISYFWASRTIFLVLFYLKDLDPEFLADPDPEKKPEIA